jgi:hypothetical protein
MMIREFRTIVTGQNEAGKSIILSDKPAENVLQPSHSPNVALTDLWRSVTHRAAIEEDYPGTAQTFLLSPPDKGSIFRIVQFPPDHERNYGNQKKLFSEYGNPEAHQESDRHPGFHKTESVDYAIVLDGEIFAMMDEGETLMRAGDTLVQRATNHAWSNRSDSPCWMAFVMIGSDSRKGRTNAINQARVTSTNIRALWFRLRP